MGGMKTARPPIAIAALALPFALYFGGYFVVVERRAVIFYNHGILAKYYPAARFGGEQVEYLYSPVMAVDRLLRPSYWDEEILDEWPQQD
jgi:hypothetical protein